MNPFGDPLDELFAAIRNTQLYRPNPSTCTAQEARRAIAVDLMRASYALRALGRAVEKVRR